MSLFNYLIDQSKKPKGFEGNIMLNIMNNAHNSIFKLGIKNINIIDNNKLLDVGFSGGKALKLLSKKYNTIKLFGIDFSEEAFKTASKNNKNYIKSGKIKLIRADIDNIPFSDNCFEIITAFQTHYYWENLPNKIKEVYRVLKNNGQFIMVAEKFKINYHMREYKNEDEIIKLFNDIGFKEIEYKEEKNNMYVKGIK
jgi:ubiquinone/menaquinone biosynthesis C-methylase UbiE